MTRRWPLTNRTSRLAWTVEVTPSAARQTGKPGRENAGRISRFPRERLSAPVDPHQIGKALKGSEPGHLWRCRVGDHGSPCAIRDGTLTVLVMAVGHRSDICKVRPRQSGFAASADGAGISANPRCPVWLRSPPRSVRRGEHGPCRRGRGRIPFRSSRTGRTPPPRNW